MRKEDRNHPQMKQRILIIEDDRNIAVALEKILGAEGFDTYVARDGSSGQSLALNVGADLVILDWMLPDRNGLDVLKAIRRQGQTPVIFLTAKDDVADNVKGLQSGADDYVTKPFDFRELVARVQTLLRRTRPADPPSMEIVQGPITIRLEERRVSREDKVLDLTRLEFDLLIHFVRNPRIVLTREILLETVWGYKFEGYQRTVDTHIRRLRLKLEPDPDHPRFIHTVRGIGYRFECET